ncbi:TonB-dependent receptor [Novosphingobium sp. KACC 22771]|uniref:TonB-dependent receptor n=1 Tax=Novosphingobium sp. KACC 22771 TaxID=3025670 RepID=UPI0023655AF3|nr:TonB-dependent receptor [Novosphingobium sp. KACC 22771]WDF71412.1 TonB-dependent receptor [Novosphingobium sp. KACC 22771]
MKQVLLTTTCAWAMVFGANNAGAQTASPAPAAAPSAAMGITDIVVTAQRRSESLQKAAIPVSAVTGEALASAGVTRPTELTALVPSLQVAAPAGPFNIFYLRGVGNFNANALSDAAVAFNIDGVFLGRPSSTTGFFYDLDRVEVVKGPQGTLYGRNATGGAINVISHKPDLGKTAARASVELGNYGQQRFDASVNVPLGDQVAVRLAGFRVRHNGYMNDGTDDQNDWGGRLSLKYAPTGNFTLNVTADYFDQGGRGPGNTSLVNIRGQAVGTGYLVPPTFDVGDRIGFLSAQGQALFTSLRAATLNRPYNPITDQPFQNNNFWGISATAEWKTGAGTLTVIPGYREGHLDYLSFAPGFYNRSKENQNQSTLEVRFATPDSAPLRALIGGFLYDERIRDPFNAFAYQAVGQYQSGLDLSTKSRALFGRLTYAVTERFRVNVGARQTWDSKQAAGNSLTITRTCRAALTNCANAPQLPYGPTPPDQLLPPPSNAGAPIVDAQTALTVANNRDFQKLTWRAGMDWDVTSSNLLYLSYETGFKAGGFYFGLPDANGNGGTYQPENIRAWTLGSKNRFFANRLQVNLEVFDWQYRDQQISYLFATGNPPVFVFGTQNAGRSRFTGFEVDMRVAATPTTTLNADVQYLDAKYEAFPTAAGVGQRPPNAPAWTLNMGAEQRIDLPSGDLVLNARSHFQSRTMTGLEFLDLESQKPYWLADAQMTYNSPGHRYYISAFINNIFDNTVKSQTFPTPYAGIPANASYTSSVAGSGAIATTLRPPRTFGVRAGINF